jgi:putative CocE/NonD family hydrolase
MRFDRRTATTYPFITVCLIVLASSRPTPGRAAVDVDRVRSRYEKKEYRIPMRDGVKLFTIVYAPRDGSKKYPILLERTPYGIGPYGANSYREALGPSRLFEESGYIFVYQDVRGCYMSEGEFEDVRPCLVDRRDARAIDESTDAYDTIDWLIKNSPNSNGKVGLWGISYPGFYAAAALVAAHPAIAAVSPQAPIVDWFVGDDTHHNGALFLQQEFNFDAVFGIPRSGPTTESNPAFHHGTDDAYRFFLDLGPIARVNELYFHGKHEFWNDVMNHGTYDLFWKRRDLSRRIDRVKSPVLTVGGWYDAEDLYGSLHVFRRIEETSPGTENVLAMGPWAHGGWNDPDGGSSLGPILFGSSTSRYYQTNIEFPFFEKHLKNRGSWNPAKAIVFETGRNAWRELDAWPPRTARRRSLYPGSAGTLGFEEPRSRAMSFDEFVSDPADPVPYTSKISIDYPASFMIEDQRFVAGRADVVSYRSAPLENDLTIAGPIEIDLYVSTSGTDSDWVVKVIDEYPDRVDRIAADSDPARDRPSPDRAPAVPGRDPSHAPLDRLAGYQRLVRGDVMRGKFRESLENPKPFEPNRPTRVRFDMQDIYHTFLRGHRLMIQIQGSWFPLVDRNPQTFVDIYHARAGDFHKATQRVYHDRDRPSRINVRVIP